VTSPASSASASPSTSRRHARQLEPGLAPGLDASREVAAQVAEADRGEHPGHPQGLGVGAREDHHRGRGVDDPGGARPDPRLRGGDADRAGDVRGVEVVRVAGVDQGRAFVEQGAHARRGERGHGGRVGDQGAAVDLDDALEVGRLRAERARQRGDELALVGDREVRVEAPLEADRGAGLLAHGRAATQRAADVAGPHLDVVGEVPEAGEGGEEPAGAFLGLDREVRPRGVADEQGVPGEQDPWLVAALGVDQQEGEVLGPVPRRRQRTDAHGADLDHVAVAQAAVLVLDARVRGDPDRRAGRGHEAPAARDVVGVVVRLEDVLDPQPVVGGDLEVLLDLPLGVHDRCLPVVSHEVGRAAEILVQHLAKEHWPVGSLTERKARAPSALGGRCPRFQGIGGRSCDDDALRARGAAARPGGDLGIMCADERLTHARLR